MNKSVMKLFQHHYLHFLCAICVICGFTLSCTTYYVRPYEKANVSMATPGGIVLSSIAIIDSEGTRRTNYQDFIYISADYLNLEFELREYYGERTANPSAVKKIAAKIEETNGYLKLETHKLIIYVANSDELVFRVAETGQ